MVIRWLAVFGVMVMVWPASVAGAAKLTVSAHVLPWSRHDVKLSFKTYLVRAADIDRGFIDLPAALVITLATNTARAARFSITSPDGGSYLLSESRAGLFTDVVIIDPGNFKRGEPAIKQYDVRALLKKEQLPGRRPLELAVAMLP